MKHAIAGLFVAAMLLAGCSGGNPPSPSGEAKTETTGGGAQQSGLKVALLTPGPISDGGWSAMAYEGLKAIEAFEEATISQQEATGPKIKDAMRSYAQQGYKIVFGHGYEYNRPAIEVAKDFPETYFISSSGGETAPNVGAFRFFLEQGFYIAGYLAGLSTKSNVLAMIGGDDVPSIRSTFKGFKAGALKANPKVRFVEVFTGNGQDVAAAKQATLKAIDEGADFVIHQANAAVQGVFDACKERGALAFGANLNQNDNESGVVIGSAIIQARPAFLNLARRVQNGQFKGEIVLMGMEDDAIDFILNEKLTAKLPEGTVAKIIALRDDIKAGVLKVPKDEF